MRGDEHAIRPVEATLRALAAGEPRAIESIRVGNAELASYYDTDGSLILTLRDVTRLGGETVEIGRVP